MSEIITTSNFRKEAKKLIKKYHSLRNELTDLSDTISDNDLKRLIKELNQ